MRQWVAEASWRVSKGESGSGIQADFVKQGLEPQSAKTIVDEAIDNALSRATQMLICGGAFAGLGLIVTVVSCSKEPSAPSFIWYGPIICGGLTAIVGLRRLRNIRL
jgi:hypothetical protein